VRPVRPGALGWPSVPRGHFALLPVSGRCRPRTVNIEALNYGWAIAVGLVMIAMSREDARSQAQKWVASGAMPERYATRFETGFQWFLIAISVGLLLFGGSRLWALMRSGAR
jgi:hypothetical protein